MDFSHRAFDPYRPYLAQLAPGRLPSPDELSTLAEKNKLDIRFSTSTHPLSAYEYESGIQQTGAIPTRQDNVHDFMNALVWLTFPVFKSALNRAHCLALAGNTHEAKQRSPLRDALTALDESGVLVFSGDPEFGELLANRQWQHLFIDRRKDIADLTQFMVAGHSILEKLLAPYPSITAKCLVISARPDNLVQADLIAGHAIQSICSPGQLPPLPVAGIPGWHPDNHMSHFYANDAIFRPLA